MTRVTRQEHNVFLELLEHWRNRCEVIVVCASDRPRVRGYVEHVAASGAFCLVWDGHGEAHVPIAVVVAIRRPHYANLEDGVAVALPPPRKVHTECAGQLALF